MSQPFRILIVEDVATDAALMLRELKRAGIRFDERRVETVVEYRRGLEDFHPHVILSDFSMPNFDGMEALRIASQSYPHIPFIFVSGTLGEEYAVRALKSGATDFVLKSNLLRLPAAVERAINEAEERRARQALEHQVRESEKQYRGLFQSNPHPMWVYDIDTLRFLAVNDTAVARYGFSREEFLAMTIKDIRPEKDLDRLLAHVAKPLPTVNQPESWQHRTKSGARIDVEIASHDLVLEGRPARIVVAYNITERRRAEEALLESESRLDLALAASGLATWEWIFATREVRFSPHWWPILGYQPHDFPLRLDAWEKLTHPDDLERVKAMVAAAAKGSIPVLDVEYRMRAKNAEWRWIRSVGRVVERNAAGLVVRMTGTHGDITERKRAEQALEQLRRQRELILDSVGDGIHGIDMEGQIIFENAAAAKMLGYPIEELIGKPAHATMHHSKTDGTPYPVELCPIYATLRDGSARRIEDEVFWRKDGTSFPVTYTTTPIRNDRREISGAVIAFHDITERNQQQEKISRLSRVQAVLCGINAAIVRIRDRDELFQEACRIAVEHGGFRVGWIALLDPATGTVTPVAHAGLPTDVGAGSDPAVGLVPAGAAEVALRERRPAFDNDIAANSGSQDGDAAPDTLSLRRSAIRLGAKSVIVLPLFVDGRAFGMLTLYAAERNFFDNDEVKLLSELAGDISFALEFIAKQEKVDYLAFYDPLTGLPNRTLFSERLGQQLQTRADSPELVAVALLDVERLRLVNDTLGRQAGDEVLRLLARRLESNATTTHWSNPARMVGDSFGVIIRGARDANELARLLEEGMKSCFGVPFVIDGKEIRLDARAGVSAFPTDGSTAEPLLHNAEAALRKAKHAKERLIFYAPEMNARVTEILALETKLRKAVELEQFVLHYQPKFDATTGKMTGIEALIRWNDPETGMVPPLQFIQILEETGMIFEVGRWALRQALADQQRWRSKGLPVPRVAVNVSARQLRDPQFVQDVQRALNTQEGLKPALELEITESLLMEDIERNIEWLKALRDLGVTVAIDDFGTGYSSLNYLARLPMDTLKIDRSFVVSMTQSPVNRTIVSTIISLAHALGLKVVAEGVETEEQLNLLRLLKCDEIQGYLLSRPVPSEAIASLFNQ